VSTASRESAAAGARAVRQPTAALLHIGAAAVVAGGFAFMAMEAWGQIERLIWRPAELSRALSAGASLAATFPLRFVCLALGSVGLMIIAEYRPETLLRLSTAAWAALGVAGTGAYLLSALDIGSRWAFAVLVGASLLGAGLLLARRRPAPVSRTDPPGSPLTRPLLPVAVGLVGGLLAIRASIEPVTEWDAVIYHVSFARDWLDSLPGLPHAAGPSVGAELSYNYPALFPAVSVVLAGALHLAVDTVARLVSPLAAITVLAVLRSTAPAGFFAGWAAPMFLLGSTFFVAYGQWPTAYMLMTVLVVLAVARLVKERRLTLATALCLGLAAGTGLIGVVIATIVVVAYVAIRLASLRGRPRRAPSLRATAGAVASVALLSAPLVVAVIGSARRTGGLFFPWISWPSAGHLLPEPYWRFARREILANSYGQFDASVGSFFAPLHGVVSSGVLAPGGLALAGVIVAACAVARPAARRALVVGGGIVAASVVAVVAAELIWLRYFLPVSVAAAALLGVVVGALRNGSGSSTSLVRRATGLAYLAAAVAAAAALASGAAYALAGPNDRTYTDSTSYRTERSSAYEDAREAANGAERRRLVYGDDSRAWDDINRLDAAGVTVGTFDVRNYYSPYEPRRQLDGLAGTAISGKTGAKVAEQLRGHGIQAVFMPSWFWEPGPARHPLTDRSPVAMWVGGRTLRAVRVYLPNSNVTYPSLLYAVGSARSARRLNALIATPSFSVEGSLSTQTRMIPGGFAVWGPLGGPIRWRIAAPVTEIGGIPLQLTTRAVTAARGVSVYEPREPTLVTPAEFVDCTRVAPWARESTLDVVFPGSPLGFASLDVGVAGPPRDLVATVREVPTSRSVLVHACGDPASAKGGVFPARSNAGRILVANHVGPSLVLAFDYRDLGTSGVSLNLYDEFRDRWTYGVAQLHRCGSGRWVHARVPVTRLPAGPGTVELGPVVTGRHLIVRSLRLVGGPRSQTDCEAGIG
jgi:hypothetical protein